MVDSRDHFATRTSPSRPAPTRDCRVRVSAEKTPPSQPMIFRGLNWSTLRKCSSIFAGIAGDARERIPCPRSFLRAGLPLRLTRSCCGSKPSSTAIARLMRSLSILSSDTILLMSMANLGDSYIQIAEGRFGTDSTRQLHKGVSHFRGTRKIFVEIAAGKRNTGPWRKPV